MSEIEEQYQYVDFYFMKGDRPSKWRRIPLAQLAASVAGASGYNCFCSVQQFSSPKPAEVNEQEMHYAPPYADFDAAGDPAAAQQDMLKLVQFAREELDLDYEAIRVWFSGSKGFHVVFSPTAFNVAPMLDLTYVYKALFGHLREYLALETLDMSVYTKRRMWRVPNSLHAKTNLYKRELDSDEITLGIDEIRELAAAPRRDPVYTDEEFAVPVSMPAQEYLARFRNEYLATKEATASDMTRVVLHPENAPGDPVCVTDIMTNGLKKPGDRNKATLALGAYYKDVGRGLDEAQTDLTGWALGLGPKYRNADDRHVIANTRSVVRTVYDNDGYHFACKFIRSLHGPKSQPNYERVACQGDACPFIKGLAPVEELMDVHLSKLGDPALLGKQVRTRLRVAGAQESAYLVPSRVTYIAIDEAADCPRSNCLLHGAGGRIERNFATEADSRTLLTLCAVPDAQQHVNLRKVIEKFSCKAFYYEIEEHVRVTELTAVPKAESFVFDPTQGGERDETGGDFVYQRMYAVGLNFAVNAYYEVTGRVYPHPKHQEATMVVTEATPMQDAIEDFELEAVLPAFKAYEGDAADVLGHLVADVGVNVVKVAGRQHALLALLMTMHAPLELHYNGDRYGGWMQTLMIGDTGEAKSQLVERLVRHVGLGELLSAQSSGRTGLLYTIITKDTTHNFIQWGAFVLNDRRLLVIDEASGIDKSGYAELRNARRDGVFKVTRSVSGEAQTRTRLVVLSNPRFGRNMSAFRNGIEAVEPLFENADIRRFDLVVGFRNGTVTRDMIEEQLAEPVEHIFTPEVLRANMLWAWSRKPEDIHWTTGSQARVKTVARELNRKYQGSDIHLLSQDANEKIARMAQALAATLHSTDATHTQVLVTPEHVDIVSELVDALYSAVDLDFHAYVMQNHDGSGDIDMDDIITKLRLRIEAPFGLEVDTLIENFSRNKIMTPFAMEAMVGESRDAKTVAKHLFNLGLIVATRGGFEPTTKFKELIRMYHRGRARTYV